MRTVVLVLVGLAAALPPAALAARQPRGTVLELHSCELYAGGCIVSSEATQGGRYMLRVWNFTDGEYAGNKLAGLQAALLQVADDNLAAADASASRAVAYLPEGATAEQRTALEEWLDSALGNLKQASLEVRVVPMSLSRENERYKFSAGNYLSVVTAPLSSCPTGSCGEALWYNPRTQGDLFTVAVNQSSRVIEPLLQLNWQDCGKKSVFLARFGDTAAARPIYVSAVDLCGTSQNTF